MSRAYEGGELEVFAGASNWKQYVASHLALRNVGSVLEVGAGLGGTTRALCDGSQRHWVCLEPDRSLAERIRAAIAANDLPSLCTVRVGTLADLGNEELFDAVLYVDVLEHISDDAAELRKAARHLNRDGRLIVLSPAHRWLFSPFDEVVGHFRRYTRATLAAAVPEGLHCERLMYLDSVGLVLSLANRLVLRSSTPSVRQVSFWDKSVVPLSWVVDRLTRHAIGKSVLGIWRARG